MHTTQIRENILIRTYQWNLPSDCWSECIDRLPICKFAIWIYNYHTHNCTV